MTPRPAHPFDPDVTSLESGTLLYRVHSTRFGASTFNPGAGSPTRFAFFSPAPEPADDHPRPDPVPVLYAAAGQDAAVAETLLHDLPPSGGVLNPDDYRGRVMSRLEVTRPLRLAALHGLGLARLGVSAEQVTCSPASTYGETVAWAAAAHGAGLDGVAYMSRRCNDTAAFVFFGDRCDDAFAVDTGFARIFATGTDLGWLIDLCAPLRIDVLPPS